MSSRRGFDRIIGQELAKRVLTKAVEANQPAHAYLFLGLQGTGKTATALELARALNCENADEGNACGECATCRAIEHGNSPDVRVWSPDGRDTKIEQMREMRHLARFSPIRGKWKVNIVEQGDTLNEESANCILKLVEEPPDYLVNILIYRNAAAVLPTIWSRCRLVRFTQVPTDELAARLARDFDVGEERARFLATYAQGRPGTAIGLVGNDGFFEKRDTIVVTAAAVSSGKPWLSLKLAEVLRSSEDKEQEETADDDADAEGAEALSETAQAVEVKRQKKSARDVVLESLDMLLVWYRDLLAAKVQGDGAAVVNSDRVDEIRTQSARYPDVRRLGNAVDAIIQTKRGILGNGNSQILTEALMMRLAV